MNYQGYLYHVVRYEKMTPGQKFVVGEKPNHFCLSMNNKDFNVGDDDVNMLVFNKNIKDFSDEDATATKNYIYHSCLIIRELVLENVRLNEFHSLPSRLKCLYACETLQEAEKWVSVLQRMDKKNLPLQIVKLKVDGKIFKGDGSLMLRNTFSVDSKIEMARAYWGQKTQSQKEYQEILFEGKAEVVNIEKDFEN